MAIFADRLKLDKNIERTDWCPSISGWALDRIYPQMPDLFNTDRCGTN
jgi:hypothetical protein